MIESLDAGKTWRARDMSKVTGMILDIKFVDATIGFIAGASASTEDKAHARILKITDGGRTWTAVAMGTSVNKIRFVTRGDGGVSAFAIGQDVFRLELPSAQSSSPGEGAPSRLTTR